MTAARQWITILLVFLAIAPAVLLTAFLQIFGLGLLAAVTVVVSCVSAGIAWLLRLTPQQAARWASRGSILVGLALGVTLAIFAHASASNCDAFCFSERGAKVFAFIVPGSYGALVALCAWVLTHLIVSWTRRPAMPGWRAPPT